MYYSTPFSIFVNTFLQKSCKSAFPVFAARHQISDHTHTIDTTHTHDLDYAIFEQQSKCSNVRVYVNNVLVNTDAVINSDVDLDITKHIKIGQRNDIRIETDSNGRITCNLFTKSFVAF